MTEGILGHSQVGIGGGGSIHRNAGLSSRSTICNRQSQITMALECQHCCCENGHKDAGMK